MEKIYICLYILKLSIILCFTPRLFAQQSNTMYFLKGIPQSQMYNPASQPKCNVFVGLPAVSNIGIDVANNALNVSEVLHHNKSLDSTLFALNPYDGDQDAFLENFGRKNYFSGLINVNLISFGFRKDSYYFTFGYRIKSSVRFLYPTDYIRLPVEGNIHGNEFDFSDFRFDVVAYQEFCFGLSKQIDPYFSVGANAKVLFGYGNVSQRKTDIGFTTLPFTWPMHLKVTQNINLPFTHVVINPTTNLVDSIDFDEDLAVSDYIRSAFKNPGFGIDLGVNYSFDDKLAISASIIDLGFIRWNSNPVNLNINSHYDMRGGYIDEFDSIDGGVIAENMIDSIDRNLIVHQNSYDAYSTALPTKIYLGGTYLLEENIQLGLLSRTEFFKKKMYQQLTISTTFFPSKVISPTFSYTMMNKSYNNLGFGTSIKLGWFHLYFISDNIPVVFAKEESTGMPIPHKMKSVNIHFGLNLLFGCNMKKLLRDKPIVE